MNLCSPRILLLYPPNTGRQPPLVLAPYRRSPGEMAGSVRALGLELMEQADGQVVPWLQALSGHIYATYTSEVRLSGDPLAAEETLARRRGACRDLAVLFIEVCRSLGLAARFVSGYQAGGPSRASVICTLGPRSICRGLVGGVGIRVQG